jgi:hypothetical protein
MISAENFKGFSALMSNNIIAEIKEALEEDKSLETLIKSTKRKEDLPPSVKKQFKDYQMSEDLLWYQGRIVVPDERDIKLKLLKLYHDSPIAGHQGQARTLELISRNYYWPGMKAQVNRYVESCKACQRGKGSKGHLPLKPLPIPEKPWENIAYDFIVKLPKSQGFDSVLVVMDRFSRMAHFIPCKESTNSEELADIFVKEVWRLHGFPKTTVSDRGTTFKSHFLEAVYKRLGIQGTFSTAFHPETDGLVERTNQWLEGWICIFGNHKQDDWAKWLPIVEFCHNNHKN